MSELTSDENILVQIHTVQGTTMKCLFESLKEFLNDVNLHFDKHGMKITAMDGNKCSCVHVKLDGDKFEKYQCYRDDIVAGVNMLSLFKLIKTIGSHDTVSFTIYKKTPFQLHINFSNENKNTSTDSMLKLLDINEDIYRIPDIAFDSQINMPSVDFQKYCRDLSVISDKLIIKSSKNMLELRADGDFASQCVRIKQTNNGMSINNKKESADEEIIGQYALKYLNLFTKSTNLSNVVELYLMNSFPLILVYYVGNLGKLQYCLAPKTNLD